MNLTNERVIITYKNFPMSHHVSHIGLGVSALNTAKVLRQSNINADVWAIMGAASLAERIKQATLNGQRPTHVTIAAPWIPTLDLQMLVFANTDIKFVVTCHSNVGFLQADPMGVKLFRDCLALERGSLNFSAAGNSKKFCNWVIDSYGSQCLYLPNLYHLDRGFPTSRPIYSCGTLRIGAFGAIRPLKNLMTAGGAILEVANDLHEDVEMHINVGRIDGGGVVLRSLDEMFRGIPRIKLVKHEWMQWPEFRRLIRSMNLILQISYTESFNMVTADAAAESIPCVVSDAVDWAPNSWKVETDDALLVSRKIKYILGDRNAGFDGFVALQKHNEEGLRAWKEWLAS